MAPRSKVNQLTPLIKAWLDDELLRRGFSNYDQLAADLKARGADISKSALHRYGSRFEERMAQLKASVEQARALVDAAPDDEDKLGGAVLRMTQEKILSVLMELDIDPAKVDVNKLLKNAAEVTRAGAAHKKFSLEARAEIRRQALQEASDQAATEAKKQGVSATGVAALREAIMGAL